MEQWEIDLRAEMNEKLSDRLYLIGTGEHCVSTGKEGYINYVVELHRRIKENTKGVLKQIEEEKFDYHILDTIKLKEVLSSMAPGNKINGKRLQSVIPFPDMQEMYANLKEDERILYDIETGYPYKVTKEYYDWYMNIWESAKPKVWKDGKPLGTVIITGTGSKEGFSRCSDAKDMFYNPENYNIKEYKEYGESETY